ncbi:hypothetical protein WB91_08685 [bacteria symbiont BFo1 of Frankliniella occidentalis]|uniref:hypothetical protein n=1 Tax=Erwinia aphidicola TaxID=68334 RepID=UPI000789D789|nr:hypothetical protein [Erwinia aphidicola]KYP90568.1 hypothetical protein WB91_08685 [bacteria symbiont BFo1 of Frankliniella occidentalis]CAH0299050.1 hypothetical protein SRABI13_04322 [Erwinia aphidicola]
MDDSIKQRLSSLLELLRNPDIKSKQAAFNACYDDLTQVKEIVSWEKIVEIIKDETGVIFDARTASNMYGRSRRKVKPAESRVTPKNVHGATESIQENGTNDKTNAAAQKKVSNPSELRNLRNRHIDLDDLKDGD